MSLRFRSPVTRPLHAASWADYGRLRGTAGYPLRDFRVTSPFAPRGDGFHGALDIGNGALGDAVVAAAAGTVLATGNLRMPWSQPTTLYSSGNYGGRMVVVEHGPRVVGIYCHLGSIAVAAGARLTAGALVGVVGDSGSAIGQGHLHFGMQAPAELVPPGVATHATIYGYGLDVDPWPLITGAAVLGGAEGETVLDPARHKPLAVADIAAGGDVYADPDRGTRLIRGWGGQAAVGIAAGAVAATSPATLVPVLVNMANAGEPRRPEWVYVGADKVSNVRLPGAPAPSAGAAVLREAAAFLVSRADELD